MGIYDPQSYILYPPTEQQYSAAHLANGKQKKNSITKNKLFILNFHFVIFVITIVKMKIRILIPILNHLEKKMKQILGDMNYVLNYFKLFDNEKKLMKQSL